MYDLNKVVNGITRYIDNELLNKIEGWQKWAFGIVAGLAIKNANQVFDNLKSNKMVEVLNIINEEDKINIEEIYKLAIHEAKKGSINVMIPTIGTVNFDDTDVTKLYNYIVNEQ